MNVILEERTKAYIRRRIAVGVSAAQIQSELRARNLRVPFAQIIAFDPERKGAELLGYYERQDKRLYEKARRDANKAMIERSLSKHRDNSDAA